MKIDVTKVVKIDVIKSMKVTCQKLRNPLFKMNCYRMVLTTQYLSKDNPVDEKTKYSVVERLFKFAISSNSQYNGQFQLKAITCQPLCDTVRTISRS